MKAIYLAPLTALLLLSGCGSDSKEETKASSNSQNIRMEQGKVYRVYKGDKIEKISSDPKLKIDANLTSGVTTIELISGAASIVRSK